MNANQLRACAVWWHKLADDAFVIFRSLEGWHAPQLVIDDAHKIATTTRALATRCEMEAEKLDRAASV